MKHVRRCLLAAAGLLVLIAAGYVAYVFGTYYRVEDNQTLSVVNNPAELVRTGETYTAVTYNVGFFAYSDDYSFFMDGGKESRAYSLEAVEENFRGAAAVIQSLEPDFLLAQEVDADATRSWHMDESAMMLTALPEYGSVWAQNYDSPYLFWPLTEPHGASRSGIMTFSRFRMDSALRRSLPIETGFTKFLDLDRCYSVTRFPVEGGGELCLYNVHLSAYTTDGIIANEQLNMLLADMAAEYAAGNYVIGGGDFNKDLLGNSSEIFGISGENLTWAQPIPTELIPEGITLVSSLNADVPVPTCRNADRPYDRHESFQVTVDGFLVSDNVESVSFVEDTGFAWSDHNPVVLKFALKK